MSITNRHSVVPFTAGESKPMTGQRLAKVGYKSTKKNPARFKSVCVSVPEIPENNIRSELDRLIPHVRTMLENAQDGIIRSLYESREGICPKFRMMKSLCSHASHSWMLKQRETG